MIVTVIATLVGLVLVIAAALYLSVRLYNIYYYRVLYPRRDLTGKTVLITGGAAGLGRAQADRFVKLGARVIIWDVSVKDLENTAEELGRSVSAARVDVANPDDVAAAAAKAGDVDILINNAGIVNGKALLELAPAQVQRILAINTFSQFLTIRAFLPRMLERNSGQIVAISSQAGLIGYARLADYAASKHALLGLMESLALELREKRSAVVTTTVCPYFVRTGLFDFDKGGVVPSVMPVMTQDFVADEIVEGVVRAEPRVVIPKVLRWLVAMRLLPYHLQLRVLEGTFFTSLIGIIQKAVR